ncbi:MULTISPECIES: CGNR zinc finger domain-containing protein [Microbacterium]|uniref:CGNR zinc finger domain-containing protein n=1 Tax=Microbacterium TaxID=33882 RepID=UPI001431C82D|nr:MULTISPECIES: ABATE domain-containing protein [Microbacterium]MCK6068254.1 CGNR zinc finger domain-containing protein [Microbacterium sp. EYE_512]
METAAEVSRTRFVGGTLALDFVNTRDGGPGAEPDDLVVSYGHLVSWARSAGVLDAGSADALHAAAHAVPTSAGDAWQRSLQVRGALDAVLRPIAAGLRPDDDALARLAAEEAEALAAATLMPARHGQEPEYEWSWDADASLHRPLRQIVHSATQLLTNPTAITRLKQCAGCDYLFMDESKNRSRRWCSMQDCGTTQKVSRYVAARRARSEGTASS